ncbi:MAG: MMPL family transporter [Chromatiales bacterium]|nr:MMPL family transporter [Chromatiales bacterium]
MHLPRVHVPLVPRLLAPLVVAAFLLLAATALLFTARNIGINTDTAQMLSSELPFRAAYERYREAFPAHVDMLVIVVDGPGPEAAELAAARLAAKLAVRPDLYSEIFLAGAGEWFENNALLWNSESELLELSERLIEVQPFLGRLTREPALSTFAGTLDLALEELGLDDRDELALLLDGLDQVLAADLAAQPLQLSWQELLIGGGGSPEDRRRYLFVKPELDFSELFPAEPGIRFLREAVAALGLLPEQGITVRITGDAALGFEELESASSGAERAGILALLMVTVMLWLALRSVWLVLATLVTLISGLSMTAGFATLAIGQLNLISIAFAVLYIGLAVDYSIHLCLRYRELLGWGLAQRHALGQALDDIGGSLVLCAVSTAVGFYAFLPTAFTGVSELGLISGTGMFINLALSVFLLPSLLMLMPAPPPQQPIVAGSMADRLSSLPARHATAIRRSTLALALVALLLAPLLQFDRNPLNLRDPDSESVATLRALMAESPTPPMNITVLAPDAEAAAAISTRLAALPEVREALTLADLLPQITDDKLDLIEELGILMGASLEFGDPPLVADGEALETMERLRARLADMPDADGRTARVADRLGRWIDEVSGQADMAVRLAGLEQRLLGLLPMNLERLSRALEAPWAGGGPPPPELRARWENADGLQRVAVYAAEDIDDNAALRRFVEAVQAIAPDATDEPVLSLRAGDAVVTAFVQAFLLALVVIATILLLVLRELRPAVLVLAPLLLAALLTGAVMAASGVPFNFANVIALPLLLGIGVDSGIHMVSRAARDPQMRRQPLASSTARAVLFSGLTTVCSFGNLLWSSHPGTASMGLVLSLGTALMLACMLVVLPALIRAPWAWRDR